MRDLLSLGKEYGTPETAEIFKYGRRSNTKGFPTLPASSDSIALSVFRFREVDGEIMPRTPSEDGEISAENDSAKERTESNSGCSEKAEENGNNGRKIKERKTTTSGKAEAKAEVEEKEGKTTRERNNGDGRTKTEQMKKKGRKKAAKTKTTTKKKRKASSSPSGEEAVKNDDDFLIHSLFSKGIHAAFSHDKIENSIGAERAIVEANAKKLAGPHRSLCLAIYVSISRLIFLCVFLYLLQKMLCVLSRNLVRRWLINRSMRPPGPAPAVLLVDSEDKSSCPRRPISPFRVC